jgi:hypothetical protein
MTPCAWPGTQAGGHDLARAYPDGAAAPQADYGAGTGLRPGPPGRITVAVPAATIDQAIMATRKAILPATV